MSDKTIEKKKWEKYYDKEYFRLKQEERRKNDPLLQKRVVYVTCINGQRYAFLQKSAVKIEKMSIDDFKKDANNIIKCF